MKKLLALLCLCISLQTFAQINFEKGYFTDSQGNKTECLIKNVAWKNNPTSFEYKLSDGAETQKATLAQVNEFSVSGYKFLKFTVDIDRSTKDLGQMNNIKEPEFKQETLFLKVLVEGKATLYQYEDGNLVRYFYSGGDMGTTTKQLIYKEYKNEGKLAHNNRFLGQLYEAMKSKLPSLERFKKISYTKEPLVKVFLEYNGQDANATENLSESQNKTDFNIKITAGANLSSLSVYNADNVNGKHDFDKALSYRFGAEFEVILPFNNNKWALFIDPHYHTYSSESSQAIGNPATNSKRLWEIDLKVIEIPMGIRHYMFLTDKSKLFINAAYVLSLPMGDSKVTSTYNFTSPVPPTVAEITKSSNFSIGAGFSYDRYSAEIRYGTKRQLLNNYVMWGADYSTIGLILAYKIL